MKIGSLILYQKCPELCNYRYPFYYPRPKNTYKTSSVLVEVSSPAEEAGSGSGVG